VIRLVAFDLDGTLARGDTVIETLARAMGHLERARELERVHEARRDRESLVVFREQIAACYGEATDAELCRHLDRLALAPGAREGLRALRDAGIETAIVTFTWDFAAAWVARELGIDHWMGTRRRPDGGIHHVWAEDKATWLADLIRRRRLTRDEVAAVGDSWRDAPMFEVAGTSFYVGESPPPGLDVIHRPDGDIEAIAQRVLASGIPTIRIVPFAAEHGPGVIDVIRSAFDEFRMTFELDGFDDDLADIPAHYERAGGVFSVLLDGERVVGSVAALPRGDDECEIKRFYLRPEHRGQGHGRRLLEHVVGWARRQGCRRAVAWSDARLPTAHEVYRRMGFVEIGQRVVDDADRSVELGFTIEV
jgi:HAD superfamily phosphoserine phosphatase-like hydrolase